MSKRRQPSLFAWFAAACGELAPRCNHTDILGVPGPPPGMVAACLCEGGTGDSDPVLSAPS